MAVVDKMTYVSGHGPLKPDKSLIIGRVGSDLTLDQGKVAAKSCCLKASHRTPITV